jgi:hypothetical protein
MKLDVMVLLEIVSLVQDGIANDRDISENLRQLDLERVATVDESVPDAVQNGWVLRLSDEYLADHPRAGAWIDDPQEV